MLYVQHKIYGYARVSSKEQNLRRQIVALQKYGVKECDIVIDKESGKNLERTGYQYLMDTLLQSGDTLVVKSLDRLSRNKYDIKQELERFQKNKIRLKILDLPTTLVNSPAGQEWVMDMVNNILIEVLGTIAEQEHYFIKQRQSEGIFVAKENGVLFGRPSMPVPENWNEVIKEWKDGKITSKKAMQLTNTKKWRFYQLVKTIEKNEKI